MLRRNPPPWAAAARSQSFAEITAYFAIAALRATCCRCLRAATPIANHAAVRSRL